MPSLPGSPRTNDHATKVIHAALQAFERESGLIPVVVLLPRRVFNQYVREQTVIEAALPPRPPVQKDPLEWADVRVVEHERIEEIEVY